MSTFGTQRYRDPSPSNPSRSQSRSRSTIPSMHTQSDRGSLDPRSRLPVSGPLAGRFTGSRLRRRQTSGSPVLGSQNSLVPDSLDFLLDFLDKRVAQLPGL